MLPSLRQLATIRGSLQTVTGYQWTSPQDFIRSQIMSSPTADFTVRVRSYQQALVRLFVNREQGKRITVQKIENPSFRTYAEGVYQRLDKIADLLITIVNVPKNAPPAPIGAPVMKRSTGMPAAGAVALGALGFGLAFGLGEGWIRDLVSGIVSRISSMVGRFIRTIRNFLRWGGNIVGRATNFFARFASRFRQGAQPRTTAPRVAGAGNGARVAQRMGLDRLFTRLARNTPLIGTVLTAIIEGFESHAEIQNLNRQYDSGEISHEEFRRRAATSVTQAILDILLTTGAGAIGATLGSIIPVAGTILGGVAGATLGHAFSSFIGPIIAPMIGRAVLAGSDAIGSLATNINNLLSGNLPMRDIIQSIPNIQDWQVNALMGAYDSAVATTNFVLNPIQGMQNIAASMSGQAPAPAPAPPPIATPQPRTHIPGALRVPEPPTTSTELVVVSGVQRENHTVIQPHYISGGGSIPSNMAFQ